MASEPTELGLLGGFTDLATLWASIVITLQDRVPETAMADCRVVIERLHQIYEGRARAAFEEGLRRQQITTDGQIVQLTQENTSLQEERDDLRALVQDLEAALLRRESTISDGSQAHQPQTRH